MARIERCESAASAFGRRVTLGSSRETMIFSTAAYSLYSAAVYPRGGKAKVRVDMRRTYVDIARNMDIGEPSDAFTRLSMLGSRLDQ